MFPAVESAHHLHAAEGPDHRLRRRKFRCSRKQAAARRPEVERRHPQPPPRGRCDCLLRSRHRSWLLTAFLQSRSGRGGRSKRYQRVQFQKNSQLPPEAIPQLRGTVAPIVFGIGPGTPGLPRQQTRKFGFGCGIGKLRLSEHVCCARPSHDGHHGDRRLSLVISGLGNRQSSDRGGLNGNPFRQRGFVTVAQNRSSCSKLLHRCCGFFQSFARDFQLPGCHR